LVFVDRPGVHLDADSVVSDNRGGASAATEHLLRHGHVRIGFLGDLLTISTAKERLAGHLHALERAGIARDDTLIRTGLRDPDAAAAAVEEMLGLPDPPTAVFTGQNLLTIGGVHALRRAGLQSRVSLIVLVDDRGSRRAVAGGGPFITAVALGRLDVSVAFLGAVSRDAYGKILTQL